MRQERSRTGVTNAIAGRCGWSAVYEEPRLFFRTRPSWSLVIKLRNSTTRSATLVIVASSSHVVTDVAILLLLVKSAHDTGKRICLINRQDGPLQACKSQPSSRVVSLRKTCESEVEVLRKWLGHGRATGRKSFHLAWRRRATWQQRVYGFVPVRPACTQQVQTAWLAATVVEDRRPSSWRVPRALPSLGHLGHGCGPENVAPGSGSTLNIGSPGSCECRRQEAAASRRVPARRRGQVRLRRRLPSWR
jgi:hypothetical protein